MKTFIDKMCAIITLAAVTATGALAADTYGLQLGLGYRQDSIRWDMEESALINPRISSKLHFKDLEIVTLGAKFKGLVSQSLYARCGFDYGWVCDGKLRQTLNIKKREDVNRFSHNGISVEGDYENIVVHNREHGNNYVWDLNFAFGMPFGCLCDGFYVAPMVGFSYNRQHLKYHNRENIHVHVSRHHAEVVPSGDCEHNNSRFNTGWWGPMVGLDLSYVSPECWSLFGELEVHFGRVERDRQSSTGVAFIDKYKRTKDFWGTTWRAGFNYIICDDWYLEGSISYARWMSHYNRDHIDWSSGGIRCDVGNLF